MSIPAERGWLLHVLTQSAWLAAQATGAYAPPELARDGFLHCCTTEQLDFVLARHFADATDLMTIGFFADEVSAEVVWVNSEPGVAAFPHLYGAIPCAAVREIRKL